MAVTGTDSPRGNDQRRERQRFEARRAILDATEALVIESAGCDFSIRSLGPRCGYSAPTVYHYFDERTEKLGEQFDALPPQDDALEELRALMVRSVDFWASNPTLARLIWSVTSKGESRMPAVMDRVGQRIGDAVRALAESGRFGDLDEDMAGQMVRALNQGLISQRINQPEHPWSPALTENAIDSLLRGMTQPALGGATR